MKLSEYIKQLQELQTIEGDLDVVAYGLNGLVDHPPARAGHEQILGKRQSVRRVWREFNGEKLKGERIILA